MTDGYINYPNESCPNLAKPCWIPQASSIIGQKVSPLPQCDSFDKYICMLNALRRTKYKARKQCTRSCNAEHYKVVSRTNEQKPFPYVSITSTSFLLTTYSETLAFEARDNVEDNGFIGISDLYNIPLQGDRTK